MCVCWCQVHAREFNLIYKLIYRRRAEQHAGPCHPAPASLLLCNCHMPFISQSVSRWSGGWGGEKGKKRRIPRVVCSGDDKKLHTLVTVTVAGCSCLQPPNKVNLLRSHSALSFIFSVSTSIGAVYEPSTTLI